MFFIKKSFMYALLGCLFFTFNMDAQGQENSLPSSPAYIIPRDSMHKYWIEMLDNRHFLWTGLGIGVINPNFTRFADEANFIPKRKNDVYTIRLRLSFSKQDVGFPSAYTREISTMYGKVYKGYKFMATASVGVSYLWGRKWLDEIAVITSPPPSGLRQNIITGTLYESEKFWTIGIPLRTQAFFIAGKELAFGVTLGTNLNIKQIWGDAMLTILLGIN